MRNILLSMAIFAGSSAPWAAGNMTPVATSNAEAINIWFSSRDDLSGTGRNGAKAQIGEMK